MQRPPYSRLRRRSSASLVSIPEESGFAARGDTVEYILDLGSGGGESSVCPTPPMLQQHIKRPIPYRPFRPTRTQALPPARKEAERDCGICFELAVAPVRTLCCSHLFCATHIASVSLSHLPYPYPRRPSSH
ncbi:hypothetical protein C8R46DRAFT_1124058 [Mycena filopes]|nr:hypothetical protein C8R46DRAFT_1124058 [Mycena filopes]